MNDFFRKFSQKTLEVVGSPGAFIFALLLLVLGLTLGAIFHFADAWPVVINMATTIITFLMVFLIQNTQNRNDKALHLKLDELIRSNYGARNTMVKIEELSDDELEQLQKQFRLMSERYARNSNHVEKLVEIAPIYEEKTNESNER